VAPCSAQIANFQHIVIIVQENRTPDNLFAAMCQQLGGPASCGTNQSQYDILTSGWNNKGHGVTPQPVDLAINWDIGHRHDPDWIAMCDMNSNNICQMDGAIGEVCKPACPRNPEFTYVQRYNSARQDVLGPYFTLARTFGWANKMFATNQGPS